MPGAKISSAPLLEHLVEKVADGVTCLYSSRNQSKGHVASAVEHLFWVARPSTTCPCPSQHISAKGSCSIVGRAPPGLTAGAADPPRAVLPVVNQGVGVREQKCIETVQTCCETPRVCIDSGIAKRTHIIYCI